MVFFAESRISLSILMPLTHPKGIQDAILRVGDACKTAYSANINKNCGVELYGRVIRVLGKKALFFQDA